MATRWLLLAAVVVGLAIAYPENSMYISKNMNYNGGKNAAQYAQDLKSLNVKYAFINTDEPFYANGTLNPDAYVGMAQTMKIFKQTVPSMKIIAWFNGDPACCGSKVQNTATYNKMIEEIYKVYKMGADGVHLDIEIDDMGDRSSNLYPDFVKNLRAKLGSSAHLSVAFSQDSPQYTTAFFQKFEPYIDMYAIMCYDTSIKTCSEYTADLTKKLVAWSKGMGKREVMPALGAYEATAMHIPAAENIKCGTAAVNAAIKQGVNIKGVGAWWYDSWSSSDIADWRTYCLGGSSSTTDTDTTTDTCANGVKDNGETDVDCGGPCPTCADGKKCSANSDCQSASCVSKVCKAGAVDTCSNSQQDGSESDVDCGGSCTKCAVGKACKKGSDCASAYCKDSVCSTPEETTDDDEEPKPTGKCSATIGFTEKWDQNYRMVVTVVPSASATSADISFTLSSGSMSGFASGRSTFSNKAAPSVSLNAKVSLTANKARKLTFVGRAPSVRRGTYPSISGLKVNGETCSVAMGAEGDTVQPTELACSGESSSEADICKCFNSCTSDSNDSGSSSSSSAVVIVIGAVAGVALIAAVAVGAVLVIRKRKRAAQANTQGVVISNQQPVQAQI